MVFLIQWKFRQNVSLVIESSDSSLPRAHIDMKYLPFKNNKDYFIFGKLLSENLHSLKRNVCVLFLCTVLQYLELGFWNRCYQLNMERKAVTSHCSKSYRLLCKCLALAFVINSELLNVIPWCLVLRFCTSLIRNTALWSEWLLQLKTGRI